MLKSVMTTLWKLGVVNLYSQIASKVRGKVNDRICRDDMINL